MNLNRNLKFTTKLSISITLLVIVGMLLILGSSVSGLFFASKKVATKNWSFLAQSLESTLLENKISRAEEWVLPVMKYQAISQITLFDAFSGKSIAQFIDRPSKKNFWSALIPNRKAVLECPNEKQIKVELIYSDPLFNIVFSRYTIAIVSATMGFVIVVLLVILNWMMLRFRGIAILEERSRAILSGESQSSNNEDNVIWPSQTNRALNLLLQNRRDRSRERTHVDTLIRTFISQDSKTGVGSRFTFEKQLAIQLEEPYAYGIIMMVRLPDFEFYKTIHPVHEVEHLQTMLLDLLSKSIRSLYSASLFHYTGSDFVILLPHFLLKNADQVASKIIQSLDSLSFDVAINKEEFLYIGVNVYTAEDSLDTIVDGALQAAKNAELQGENSWFIFGNDLSKTSKTVMGSVRWRTLLTQIVEYGKYLKFNYRSVISTEGHLLHREINVCISHEGHEWLPAEFIVWLNEFNMNMAFDKRVITRVLYLLEKNRDESVSFPVNVESLLQAEFLQWFVDILKEKGKAFCHRLTIELPEIDVANYTARLLPVMRALKNLGCQIGVLQAGLMVVNTEYTQLLPIDIIKLYSGLVRNINKHPENQLIIESLSGACEETCVSILACGVRSQTEWSFLNKMGVSGGQGELFVLSRSITT